MAGLERVRSLFAGGLLQRKFAVLFAGTVVGQALPMLVSPLLTRLYRPEQFGVLGVFSAICIALVPMMTLRYEFALLLARGRDEVADALGVCAAAIALNTGIAFLAVALIGFHDVFGLAALEPVKFLLPPALLMVSAYQLLAYEATRQDDLRPVALTKLVQGVVGPGVQIGLGWPGLGALGLVIGFIAGQTSGTVSLLRRLIAPQWADLRRTSPRRLLRFARRFRRFPLLSSWSSVLSEAGNSYLAIVLVMALYAPEVAGFLFLADRLVGRPLLLVTTSTLQAVAGDLSQLVRSDPRLLLKRFNGIVAAQFAIASVWCGLVALLAPVAVTPLFGASWAGAVPYIQVVSVAYLFLATLHPVSPLLQIMERQGLIAAWELMRCTAVTLSIAGPAWAGADAVTAVTSYACAQAVLQLIYWGVQVAVLRKLAQDAGETGAFLPAAALAEEGKGL